MVQRTSQARAGSVNGKASLVISRRRFTSGAQSGALWGSQLAHVGAGGPLAEEEGIPIIREGLKL